jgi:hypothetical protein
MKRYFIFAFVSFFLIFPTKKIFCAELRINYPNGGEKLTIGKYINIQWSSTGFPDIHRVKLELIRNGMYYGRIAVSIPINEPRYLVWKVGQSSMAPIKPGSGYTIRITDLWNTNYMDESDTPFTLVSDPSIAGGKPLLQKPKHLPSPNQPKAHPKTILKPLPDLILKNIRIVHSNNQQILEFYVENRNKKSHKIEIPEPNRFCIQLYAISIRAQVFCLNQNATDNLINRGLILCRFPWEYTSDTRIIIDFYNVVKEANEENNQEIFRQ